MARIVIAEDYDQLRVLICTVLQQAGHEVLQTRNGRECMQVVRASTPDIVITDLLMPEKDGLEIMMELRREFPLVPIIAMSGSDNLYRLNLLPVARKLGAVRIVAKPFLMVDFLEVVDEVLELAAEPPVKPPRRPTGENLRLLFRAFFSVQASS